MKRNVLSKRACELTTSLVLAVGAGLASGCAMDASAPEEATAQGGMSFEEFVATVPRESDTGIYLVEGDIPIRDLQALRDYYDTHVDTGALIQNSDSLGHKAVLDEKRKNNISFCVDKKSFRGTHYYETFREAILRAAISWEETADVDFKYMSSEDDDCSTSNNKVYFNVEYTDELPPGVAARAFFPDVPRSERRIRVSNLVMQTQYSNVTGLFRHELGHVLGFYHEHRRVDTSAERAQCNERGPYFPLTPVDRKSVMFYNFCGGGTRDYAITTMDANGAATLYGVRWHRLDAAFKGEVAATHTAPHRIDLFVRGTSNRLEHRWYTGNSWTDWETLPGEIASSPAAVSRSSNSIDVFARGKDNSLQHKWYDGSWSGWENLGGVMQDAPAVTSWGPGQLDVFARGTGDRLYHKWYNGRWSGWEDLGGVINSSPSAASYEANKIDVFARGSNDNALWQRRFNGSWKDWTNRGGVLTSSPAAFTLPKAANAEQENLNIFVRGTGNVLYQLRFLSKWREWERLGGTFPSAPSVVRWGNGWIVFVHGNEGNIWHSWFNPADPNEF